MAINIKNYTSQVAVSASMAKIEKNLVLAGARDIMKRYSEDGICNAVAFTLPIDNKQLTFQLPAKVDPIYKMLIEGYVRPTEISFKNCREQAERSAWKIVSDWVEIQLTMIKLEQADTLEVFFPYLYDGKQTYYQKVLDSGLKLIGA